MPIYYAFELATDKSYVSGVHLERDVMEVTLHDLVTEMEQSDEDIAVVATGTVKAESLLLAKQAITAGRWKTYSRKN